jgi:hypothetical protein
VIEGLLRVPDDCNDNTDLTFSLMTVPSCKRSRLTFLPILLCCCVCLSYFVVSAFLLAAFLTLLLVLPSPNCAAIVMVVIQSEVGMYPLGFTSSGFDNVRRGGYCGSCGHPSSEQQPTNKHSIHKNTITFLVSVSKSLLGGHLNSLNVILIIEIEMVMLRHKRQWS